MGRPPPEDDPFSKLSPSRALPFSERGSEPEEEGVSAAPLFAPAGYRVPGNLQARVFELERRLLEAQARTRETEHALYAARKALRSRERLRASAVGGLGALLGSIVGAVFYSAEGNPYFVVFGTVIGFAFGALCAALWNPPDDGFPRAPPPRFY
jgi:F0F1-type ATP synthase assembly protein I